MGPRRTSWSRSPASRRIVSSHLDITVIGISGRNRGIDGEGSEHDPHRPAARPSDGPLDNRALISATPSVLNRKSTVAPDSTPTTASIDPGRPDIRCPRQRVQAPRSGQCACQLHGGNAMRAAADTTHATRQTERSLDVLIQCGPQTRRLTGSQSALGIERSFFVRKDLDSPGLTVISCSSVVLGV
jgi:hypothetical protein